MGRMMPMDCAHGVTVDYGDFGPCQDCYEHEGEPCPNIVECSQCEAEWEAQVRRVECMGDKAYKYDELVEVLTEAFEAGIHHDHEVGGCNDFLCWGAPRGKHGDGCRWRKVMELIGWKGEA